jgi:rhomboid protease GluP
MTAEMLLDMLLFTAGAMSLLVAILSAARTPRASFPHSLLLGAGAAGAFVVFFARFREPWAVALPLSAFGAWAVAPALLLAASRRLARADRFHAAADLLLFRFPLAPSPASWLEFRVLQAFEQAAAGDFEAGLARLEALRAAPWMRPLRPRLHDAALDLCLREFRWDEASAWIDRDLEGFEASARALPRLWVLALHARCEAGQTAQAAALLTRMAGLTPHPVAPEHLAGAYMIFLACSGEPEKLETLFREGGGVLDYLPPAVREAWLGRAHRVRGNRELAEFHFQSASEIVRQSNPNLIRRIERLQEAPARPVPAAGDAAVPWPPPLRTAGNYVSPRSFASPRLQRAPATLGLLAACLAALAVFRVVGNGDPLALLALGANVDFLVQGGQFWRLGSSIFLHADVFHFLFNALGLLVLGNLLENLYGTSRFLAIYALSGFAGSALSYAIRHPILSVGASGAILGLVGAGIAFLVVRGSALPAPARRTQLFLFLFIAAADVAFGFTESRIDNVAHLGGLGAGFLAGMLARPVVLGAGEGGWRRAGARAAGFLSAAALAACAVLAARNYAGGAGIPAGIPFRTEAGRGAIRSVEVPSHWDTLPEEEALVCRSPFLAAVFEDFEREPMALERQAALLEEDEAGAGERRPRLEPKSAAADGRALLLFEGPAGADLVQKSWYFEERGRCVRARFLGSARSLEIHEKVLDRILAGIRVGACGPSR